MGFGKNKQKTFSDPTDSVSETQVFFSWPKEYEYSEKKCYDFLRGRILIVTAC